MSQSQVVLDDTPTDLITQIDTAVDDLVLIFPAFTLYCTDE